MKESTKEKIRQSMIGRYKGYKHSDESRKHMSEAHLGQKPSNTGITGVFHHSEDTRKKISNSMTGRKLTKEHIRNALRRRPMSSLEKKFNDIIQRHNLPYKFVGNGDFFIERKNPDFISTDQNKVAVEVYFTRQKAAFKNNGIEGWIKERTEIFNKYGWTIIFFSEVDITEELVLEALCE